MIQGEKVRLVPLEAAHLDKSRLWVNDPEVRQGVLRILPVTSQDQLRWYENLCDDPSRMVFAIQVNSDDRHVGNTGFYQVDAIHKRAEFWMYIGEKQARGQGMGHEVLSLMLAYGFHGLNLNKVFLFVGVENQAAITLYEKAGFQTDGRLREHYFMEGRYMDVLAMSFLRQEYHDRKE